MMQIKIKDIFMKKVFSMIYDGVLGIFRDITESFHVICQFFVKIKQS